MPRREEAPLAVGLATIRIWHAVICHSHAIPATIYGYQAMQSGYQAWQRSASCPGIGQIAVALGLRKILSPRLFLHQRLVTSRIHTLVHPPSSRFRIKGSCPHNTTKC